MLRRKREATNKLKKICKIYQKTVYPLVIGQCSPALRAQLDGMKGYDMVNSKHDDFEVLKMIKSLCCRHNQNNDKTHAVVMSLKELLYSYQKPEMTNEECYNVHNCYANISRYWHSHHAYYNKEYLKNSRQGWRWMTTIPDHG